MVTLDRRRRSLVASRPHPGAQLLRAEERDASAIISLYDGNLFMYLERMKIQWIEQERGRDAGKTERALAVLFRQTKQRQPPTSPSH